LNFCFGTSLTEPDAVFLADHRLFRAEGIAKSFDLGSPLFLVDNGLGSFEAI
jgi:hypothetical protein